MVGLSPPLHAITTAVLTLLRGDAPERGPRWVYDAQYDGDPQRPAYPYGILYRISGGSSDTTPDLDDSRQTLTIPYQVTSVSDLRNQCEHAAQGFHDRLLGRTATSWLHPLVLPAPWVCIDRRPDPAMPGIDSVGQKPTDELSLPARYYLTIAPD